MTRPVTFCFILLLALSAGTGLGAEATRSFIEDGPAGSETLVERSQPASESAEAWFGGREGGVVWQRSLVPPIYNSCDIGYAAEEPLVIAGSELNSAVIEMLLFDGDGTPEWSRPTETAFVDAEGQLFAAIEKRTDINGAELHCWQAGAEAPLWSKEIPDCAVPARAIRLADAPVLAVGLSKGVYPANYVKVLCFDANTGDLLSSFDSAPGKTCRAMEISSAGDRVAVRASTTVYVIDSATGAEIWSVDVGASADPLGFSGNGEWIASGWTLLEVYRWNGETYEFQWLNTGTASFYLRSCAFSEDGSLLMAGWYRNTFNQNRVDLFDTSDNIAQWTYTYDLGGGEYQDVPAAIAMDEWGEYAVVGSWGDQVNTNPEIHVFSTLDPEPVLTIDAPGSMFDVGISSPIYERGRTLITACGKHVHANQMGNSGDLFAIEYIGTGLDESAPPSALSLNAYPNPFNPKVTLSFTLAEAGNTRLDIHSVDGARVRALDAGFRSAGEHQILWDGRTDTGALAASGVYLAKLRSAAAVSSERLVLLR